MPRREKVEIKFDETLTPEALSTQLDSQHLTSDEGEDEEKADVDDEKHGSFEVEYNGKTCVHFVLQSVDADMLTGNDNVQRPVIVLHGWNEPTSSSITCFVHQTSPYIWVKWDRRGVNPGELGMMIQNDVAILKAVANKELKQQNAIIDYSVELRWESYGYRDTKDVFVKVNFAFGWLRPRLADLIREGLPGTRFHPTPYEAHIDFTMQFVADSGIQYFRKVYISDWEVESRPPVKVDIRTGLARGGVGRKSFTDHEIHCAADSIENRHFRVIKARGCRFTAEKGEKEELDETEVNDLSQSQSQNLSDSTLFDFQSQQVTEDQVEQSYEVLQTDKEAEESVPVKEPESD